MKIIPQYQCEVCKRLYKTEQEGITCETQVESEKTSSIKIGDSIEFVRELAGLGAAVSTYIEEKGIVRGSYIDHYTNINIGKHTRVFEVEVAENTERNLKACIRLVFMEFGTIEGDKFFSPGIPGFEFTPELYWEVKKQKEQQNN